MFSVLKLRSNCLIRSIGSLIGYFSGLGLMIISYSDLVIDMIFKTLIMFKCVVELI